MVMGVEGGTSRPGEWHRGTGKAQKGKNKAKVEKQEGLEREAGKGIQEEMLRIYEAVGEKEGWCQEVKHAVGKVEEENEENERAEERTMCWKQQGMDIREWGRIYKAGR